MSEVLPFVLSAAGVLTVLAILYASMLRAGLLHPSPATVDPFRGTSADPSADTLSNGSEMVKTAPPISSGEWHVTTLHDLTAVEDLLDSLENHQVSEREVIAIGNSTFAVRWR